MDFIKEILQKNSTRRILILAVFGLVLYLIHSMLNMLLLTFIFTFLMYSIQNFLSNRLKRFVHIRQRILIIFLYLLLALGITLALYKYLPVLFDQIKVLIQNGVEYYKENKDKPQDNPLMNYIFNQLKDLDLSGFANQGVGFVFRQANLLKDIGLDIIFAIVLSLFFLLEKNRISRFTARFKYSRLSGFYNEIEYFGIKFVNSFGKVLEAQFIIAFVNSILSIIALWIMGFPQVLALGIMIFLLGLIPVAGVLVSLVPLSMIAYNIGGFKYIIYVLIMIAVLHALESYFLNPKLMSAKTELPIFYTFIILIFSEHFFGVWGLIIGIPVFIFFLDLLGVREEGLDTLEEEPSGQSNGNND